MISHQTTSSGMRLRRIVGDFVAALAVTMAAVTSLGASGAEAPELIKDVNARTVLARSLCGDPVRVGAAAFFCGADDELWVTDGTEAGTYPVRQPNGLVVRFASDLTGAGRWLYFTLSDGLWRTDGSQSGTMQIVDAEGDRFHPILMTNVDDDLYFFRFDRDPTDEHELWKTDGTLAGTRQVYSFLRRFNPFDAVAMNGELYFMNHAQELWKSDGTEAGTRLLKDIEGSRSFPDHRNLTDVNGVLYFSAESPDGHLGLWKSDGTADGTVLVKASVTTQSTLDIADFTNVDGRLFFTAESNFTDRVIWKSDGTTSGTVAVTTLRDTRVSSTVALRNLFLVGTRDGGVWRSNGWPGGTFRLTTDFTAASVQSLVVHEGLAYFAAENDTGLGDELWATDGTQQGTRLVRDIHWGHWPSSPGYFASIEAGLIFQANRGRKFGGPALWISDGTRGGTRQVVDIDRSTPGSYPSLGTVVGEHLYFVANIEGNPAWGSQWELWRTDGTRAGTQPMLDLHDQPANPGQFYRGEFVEMAGGDGTLFLSGRDAAGWGLWRKASPAAEFEKLSGLLPVTPSRPITGLTAYRGDLFFFADTWSSRGLWRLRSGDRSAELVQDDLENPRDVSIAQNRLVFLNAGDELWWSDGTWGGTRRIKSLALGPDATIDRVQHFGGRFLFRVSWGFEPWGYTNKIALFVSDFTASGTRKLRQPYPRDLAIIDQGILYIHGGSLWLSDGSNWGRPVEGTPLAANLTEAGGIVYFEVRQGGALWRTDGTSAGTMRIAGGFELLSMTEIHGQLYFTAARSGNTEQRSLYRSDGTAAGTVVLEPGVSTVEPLAADPNRFLGGRQDEPRQIWETDGTAEGTHQLSDLQPGSGIGSFFQEPFEFRVGGRLVLVVDDGVHGAELWGVDPPDPSASGVMGDYVWLDADQDGVQDDDEQGLADVPIRLESCGGDLVDSTRSDADGRFRFDHVASATYRLRFEAPYAHGFSPAAAAGDYRIDSDADPVDGTTWCADMSDGQRRLAMDAGLIREERASLGDRVWNDVNGDGVQDLGEPGFPGVTVHLETCDGRWLRSAQTAGDGSYLFDYVQDGDYRLRFYLAEGYRFSPKNATDDYRVDSNAHPVTGLDSCRTVHGGQQRLALDAGLVATD